MFKRLVEILNGADSGSAEQQIIKLQDIIHRQEKVLHSANNTIEAMKHILTRLENERDYYVYINNWCADNSVVVPDEYKKEFGTYDPDSFAVYEEYQKFREVYGFTDPTTDENIH